MSNTEKRDSHTRCTTVRIEICVRFLLQISISHHFNFIRDGKLLKDDSDLCLVELDIKQRYNILGKRIPWEDLGQDLEGCQLMVRRRREESLPA